MCRGQDIRSSTSHKSYRPLCTLLFRGLGRLAPLRAAAVAAWEAEDDSDGEDEGDEGDEEAWPEGQLDPLIFHAASAVLHAVVAIQVYRYGCYDADMAGG